MEMFIFRALIETGDQLLSVFSFLDSGRSVTQASNMLTSSLTVHASDSPLYRPPPLFTASLKQCTLPLCV